MNPSTPPDILATRHQIQMPNPHSSRVTQSDPRNWPEWRNGRYYGGIGLIIRTEGNGKDIWGLRCGGDIRVGFIRSWCCPGAYDFDSFERVFWEWYDIYHFLWDVYLVPGNSLYTSYNSI
jgi:hypothetical protein